MIGSYNLVVSKNELEENLFQLRENLITNQEIIITLRTRFCEYSNNTSTSKTVEVLRNHALDIIKILDEFIDLYAIMINKVNQIYYRYEELCGNSSLDENELKKTISKIDYLITLCEESIYHFRRVDGINVVYVQYLIDELIQYRRLYERKLNNLREFNDYVNNIFSCETDRIKTLTKELKRKVEVFSKKNKSNNNFSNFGLTLTHFASEVVQILTLKEQEELLGIYQKDFIKLYKEMFGFNDTDIEVLWQLKVAIYNHYGKENGEFYFNYIIGRMYYNPDSGGTDYWVGKGFDVILGDLDELTSDTSSFKSFLAKISGLKIEQINDIYYKIRLQHTLCGGIESIPNRDFTAGSPMFAWLDKYLTSKSYSIEKINEIKDNLAKYGENSSYISILNEAYNFWNNEASRMSGKMDFVHYSITTATVLCPDEKSYILEQVGKGFDDESGWYGDVYGFNQSMEGSINQIDYISDLDAENIVSYMKENNISSLDVARQKYLENIKNGSLNRAEYFKKNNPEVLDFIMEEALNNYTVEKNRNNVPPSFTSPEAQRAYNDSLKQKCRLEFEKLSCDEKMKYVRDNVKDFAYSLLTNRNELIDYEK